MRASLLILAAYLTATTAAVAQEGPPVTAPTITVQGEASAQVVPDTVVVTFGVVTQRPSAAAALGDNSKAVAAAIAAVKAEGVKPEDISTTNAGLTPQMSDPDKGPAKIVGYRAENQVQVRLKPADRAGDILGKVVDKGVNDIESVAAVVSDDAALRDRLKADAARDARRQAEIYTSALGLKLGFVTRIDPEAYYGGARPVPAPKMMAARAAVPVEMGQQTVTETVRVTFSLQQP